MGIDGWQAPNGFDVAGFILYYRVPKGDGSTELMATPIDFAPCVNYLCRLSVLPSVLSPSFQ